MTIDYTLEEMIELVKEGSDKIRVSSGDREFVHLLSLHYGPIAYKLYKLLETFDLRITLDPKVIYNRKKNCACDLNWPEFWNSGDMIIALCQFLDSIKEKEIYAKTSPAPCA